MKILTLFHKKVFSRQIFYFRLPKVAIMPVFTMVLLKGTEFAKGISSSYIVYYTTILMKRVLIFEEKFGIMTIKVVILCLG